MRRFAWLKKDARFVFVGFWLAAVLVELLLAGHFQGSIPGICASAVAMAIFYRESKNVSGSWLFYLLALFCLNPAILFNTAVSGRADIIGSLLAILAILFVLQRPIAAGISCSLALLTAVQSVSVVPILFVYAFQQRRQGRGGITGKLALGMAIPLLVCTGYFVVQGHLLPAISPAYMAITAAPGNADMNAMNIWFYLFGTNPGLSDQTKLVGWLNLKQTGLILFTAAVCYVCIYVCIAKTADKERLLKAAALLSLAFYMLPTGVHPAYILLAVVSSLFAARHDKRWHLIALGLTMTGFWNMWTVLYSTPTAVADMWMVCWNSVIFIAMFVLAGKEMGRTSTFSLLEQPDEGNFGDTKATW